MATKNGRVTIALIGRDLKYVLEQLKSLDSKVDELMLDNRTTKEQFLRVDRLENRINKLGVGGIIGSIIAGALAIFLPNK